MYKEYKALNNKVLFDIDNFIYGTNFITAKDIKLISLNKEDAIKAKNDFIEESNKLDRNAENVYNNIEKIKYSIIASLIINNKYSTNDIKIIEHND